MSVVTRFAPSPTGYLHIGGARTALFNWLFAKRMGGQFLLRIEDTDRARSTDAAIEAILDGMDWLDLKADAPPIYQFARAERHREAAKAMIARGTAFRCYETPQEIEQRRQQAAEARERHLRALSNLTPESQDQPDDALKYENADAEDGTVEALQELDRAKAEVDRLHQAFRSRYRDGLAPPSADAPFVIRLRAPDSGEIVNDDLVQGRVSIAARDIDDLVLLRADGTPTYMLSVVVDDHDMGVTHVIRGDDHLTNAARQIPIFQAMDWTPPRFAHIPLIHGPDGAKLSKRHGALAVQAYRDMGYLPEGLAAYLMRLGWSPSGDHVISKEEAISQFDLAHVGKGPARLDFDKLGHVNAHFLRAADDQRLAGLLFEYIAAQKDWPVSDAGRTRATRAIPVLKTRAKTIAELADQALFLLRERPLTLDAAAQKLVKDEMKARLRRLRDDLASHTAWDGSSLADRLKAFLAAEGVGMGQIGPGLRAVLTGGAPAPDLGQVLEFLGRDEALARIGDQV